MKGYDMGGKDIPTFLCFKAISVQVSCLISSVGLYPDLYLASCVHSSQNQFNVFQASSLERKRTLSAKQVDLTRDGQVEISRYDRYLASLGT